MAMSNERANGLMRVAAAGPVRAEPAGDAGTTERLPAGEEMRVDLCVIGGGAGGLGVAAAAAELGVSVALVEKDKLGGDSLNAGCVPAKALIAAARRAHAMRTSAAFGIVPTNPKVDYKALRAHIDGVIAAIAPNASLERLTGLGVRVVQATAHFISKDTIQAGGLRIKANRFVVATGSAPALPPIPGLKNVPYLTSETVFRIRERPDHLVIVGGGPMGVELAQAFVRLGSRVTILEEMKVLAKEDPEIAAILIERLQAEGVDIHEGVRVERVSGGTRLIDVHVSENGVERLLQGSDLLLATGREPDIGNLNLEAAGIKYDRRGIFVGRGLVTSNRRVYAVGDVVDDAHFTHIASYHAGVVLRRALLRLPARTQPDLYPRVTYADPEIAHVGLSEDEARKRHGRVHVYRWPMHDNDRAQAERETLGYVKVVTRRNGRILGASIVGAQAGELIQVWCLALSQGMGIKAMTQWIAPYPTLGEINRRVAFGYYTAAAANPFVRKLIGWLAKLSS